MGVLVLVSLDSDKFGEVLDVATAIRFQAVDPSAGFLFLDVNFYRREVLAASSFAYWSAFQRS